MSPHDAILASFAQAEMIVNAYLADLTDQELLARPSSGINHIAWQMGHLIGSEHGMVSQVVPGSMPALPENFMENHGKSTDTLDDPAAFLVKDEYVAVMNEQREGTKAALASLSAERLSESAPKELEQICPNVASVFSMQPVHWIMHAGQWAVTRRTLGRPPLF